MARINFDEYSDEIAEGENAFAYSKSFWDCPYEIVGACNKREAWQKGWLDAQEKAGE